MVDEAVLEALGSTAERRTIAELEEMTIKFIGDPSRDIIEYPASLGSYQVRMEAHASGGTHADPLVRRKCSHTEWRKRTGCKPALWTQRKALGG